MKGLVPVAMILIGRGGPREHPPTSRGKGPTRADIAQLPVAHAHTPSTPFGHYGGYCATSGCACAHIREHPKGSRDLRSLPVAMVLVLLYYILHYYSSKKKTHA